MNLYAIAETYKNTFDHINELEEITQDDFDKLNTIGESFESKAIAVASFMKNKEFEGAAILAAIEQTKERLETLKKMKGKVDSRVESLAEYLKINMERCQITEIGASPYFTIKLKKCPPSLFIVPGTVIEEKYKRVKTTVSDDKDMIKEDLKSGIIVDGCSLKHNVRVEIK